MGASLASLSCLTWVLFELILLCPDEALLNFLPLTPSLYIWSLNLLIYVSQCSVPGPALQYWDPEVTDQAVW